MTIEEFDNNVVDFCDLIDFCIDYECDIASEIKDIDELDSFICEDIRDCISHQYWHDIRDRLNDIYEEQYGEWFIWNGSFNYTFIDENEFDRYKDRVRRWASDNDIFDCEEEALSYECDSMLFSFNDEPEQEDIFEVSDLSILLTPA